MRKLLLLLISLGLLAGCGLLHAQTPLYISDFSGGIRNNVDATRIADNEVSDAENVLFDDDATAKTRGGMIKSNSTALGSSDNRNIYSQFEYRRSDGSSYHIVHSSKTLYYRETGSEWTAFKYDISSTTAMNYTVFMDTLAYCNGVSGTGVMTWDTNTTSTYTLTYSPKYITTYQNRLVIGGMADAPSTVRFSGFQNPSDWTVGTDVSTAPVSFSINTQDGQNVVGFFWSPNGNLGVLKEKSVWEIGGYDTSDFYQRLTIPDIGCTDSGGVCYREGVVYWLSSEGIVGYDGKSYSIVSDKIQGTIDDIQQVRSASGFFIKDTQTQWENYTSTAGFNTSDTPGKLTIKPIELSSSYNGLYPISLIRNDNLYIFNSELGGRLYHIALSTTSWSIVDSGSISTSIFYPIYYGPSANKFVNTPYAVSSSSIIFAGGVTPLGGDNWQVVIASGTGNSFTATIVATATLNSTNESIVSVNLDSSNNPHVFFSSQTTIGSQYYMDIYYTSHTGSGWITPVKTTHTLYNLCSFQSKINNNIVSYVAGNSIGGSYNIVYASATNGTSNFSSTQLAISSITEPSSELGKLQYDSSNNPYIAYHDGFQLAITSNTSTTGWSYTYLPIYGVQSRILDFNIDNDDNLGFIVRTSTNPYGTYMVGYFLYSLSSGALEEIKCGDSGTIEHYKLNYDQNSYPVGFAQTASSVNVSISTSTYISEIYDSNFSQIYFDIFTSNLTANDYNITHSIRVGTSTIDCNSSSWNTVSNNAIPSISAEQYIQYKVEASTKTLTLNYGNISDTTINYKSSSSNIGLSSMYYDGRIYEGVSITNSTYLDKILVYDSNNAWTKFSSDIEYLSFLNINNVPFVGSNDGYLYQMDISNSDDGNAIDAYVLTKQYDLGAITYQKSMKNLFLLALETGDWDLNLDYYIDKSATATESFTVDLDSADLINYKVPLAKHPRFYTIQYKLYNNTANQPFSFMSIYTQLEGYPIR